MSFRNCGVTEINRITHNVQAPECSHSSHTPSFWGTDSFIGLARLGPYHWQAVADPAVLTSACLSLMGPASMMKHLLQHCRGNNPPFLGDCWGIWIKASETSFKQQCLLNHRQTARGPGFLFHTLLSERFWWFSEIQGKASDRPELVDKRICGPVTAWAIPSALWAHSPCPLGRARGRGELLKLLRAPAKEQK